MPSMSHWFTSYEELKSEMVRVKYTLRVFSFLTWLNTLARVLKLYVSCIYLNFHCTTFFYDLHHKKHIGLQCYHDYRGRHVDGIQD